MAVYIQPNGGIFLSSPVYIDNKTLQAASGDLWTPTYVLQGNLSGTITNLQTTYIQVGNVVNVHLSLVVNVVAPNIAAVLNVTNLPVARPIFPLSINDVGVGTYFASSTVTSPVEIDLVGGTIIQQITWMPTMAGLHNLVVNYTYVLLP